MSNDDDKVTDLASRRKRPFNVAMVTLPPPEEQPPGPFTVTVSDQHGKMFEVTFPDHTAQLSEDVAILGTAGCYELLANLLAGTIRVYLGAR